MTARSDSEMNERRHESPERDAPRAMRDRIIEEATKRFARDGFASTSVQSIAESVGIRKPSLLYHFSTKDELRDEVIDGVMSRWNDVLPALMRAASSGEGRLDSVVDEVMTFFAAEPDRARLLVREMLDRPDSMRDRLRSQVAPWMDFVTRYVRTGIDEGTLHRGVDPETWVLVSVELLVGGIALGDVLGVLLDDDAAAAGERWRREIKRIVRDGLFVTAASAPPCE
jgi:AcrR family transcriptional regulator